MATAGKHRAQPSRAESFLAGFVHPLVAGGELHVGAPLGVEELAELRAEAAVGGDPTLASEELRRVEQARQARATELWLYPVPTTWDETSACLSAAIHNLLFFSHPDAARWSVSRVKRQRLIAFSASLLHRAAPSSAEEVVARHTIVGNLLRLQRRDVVVEYWAAIEEFRGQIPPARLLRWPRLRRLRHSEHTVSWLGEETLADDQQALLAQILALSPLSDLVALHRSVPPFSWLPLARYLQQPLLARLVCHLYLESGLDVLGAALARTFWQLVSSPEQGRAPAVRTVCGLLGYLCALHAMVSEAPLTVEGDDPAASLIAVVVASADCELLPGEEAFGSPEVLERLRSQIAAARAQLGPAADNLAAHLRAALHASAAAGAGLPAELARNR
jgi:hypothetical protein